MSSRRTGASSTPTPPSLPPGRAAELLRTQSEKATALQASPVVAAIEAWTETTSDLLIRALGSDHRLIMRFHGAGVQFMMSTFATREQSAVAFLTERLPFVDSAIEVLDLSAAEATGTQPCPSQQEATSPKAIFVVHGHDESLRESTARWLQNVLGDGCSVVILHEQPSGGRTLIEKFERYGSSAAYAVVLLTADDVGAGERAAEESTDQLVARLQLRARQNVVFEMGFFVGRLGRNRVAVLYEEGVELPSDLQGIVYIPADGFGGWKELLRNELREAGLLNG